MVSSYMVSGFVKERASTSVIDILATVLLASRYGRQGWEISAVSPQAAALDVQHTVCMRCLSFGRGSRAGCKKWSQGEGAWLWDSSHWCYSW